MKRVFLCSGVEISVELDSFACFLLEDFMNLYFTTKVYVTSDFLDILI